MNNKILRKLTLSAVTLGVAALSLTTTTYAWFTTNSTVTAKNVSGTVQSSDVLMLIKNPASWTEAQTNATTTPKTAVYTSVNFAKEITLVPENTTTALQPVAIKQAIGSGVAFTEAKDDHTFSETSKIANYVHYQVVIALSSLQENTTYDVKMTLPQLNQDIQSQYLVANAGNHADAAAGKTLTFGVYDALSIGIKNTIVTSSNNGSYGITTAPTKDASFVSQSDASGYYHAITETSAGDAKGDAIAYYNNVYGISSVVLPTDYANYYSGALYNQSSSKSAEKKLYSITGVTEAVIATDLYFFIDGWDYQCFNAIGGLSLFATGGTDNGVIKFEVAPQQNS